MKKVRTSVEISATPAQVWAALADTGAWADWNDVLLKLEGSLVEGGKAKMLLKFGDGKPTGGAVTLVAWRADEELAWRGGMGPSWFFAGHHFFRLTDNGDGTTRLDHGEDLSGLLPPLLFWKLGPMMDEAYGAFNTALKAHVEA